MLALCVTVAALVAPQLASQVDVSQAAAEAARVLGFSEDGTRALVEERTVGRHRENIVRYVVLSVEHGRELEVTPEGSVKIAPGLRAQLVGGDDCRAARDALEKALVGFRTVRIRQGACSELVRRTLVDELKQPPSPLAAGSEELVALQKRIHEIGDVFVSDDGPIVVVIGPDPNALVARAVVEHVFVRADPRVNKRWPDPPL